MSDTKKVGMVSLGCSKNQVDSEIMLSKLNEGGFVLSADPNECDAVIINTCGFIEDAKREAIETILEFCEMKREGQIKAVIVTGCLAERYRDELAAEIPEADVVLGLGKNGDIVKAVTTALEGGRMVEFGEKTDLPLNGSRILANPNYFAYLKLGDGCDNWCTYCAIPSIRGRFRSRTMEDILAEANNLAKMGVKELNLIAQDVSRYGEDLYGKSRLPELLTELCKIDGIEWIRLLYCYPDRITDELLQVMASEEKIVKYLDMPLQHANGRVLKKMNRFGNREVITELVNRIRKTIPGITLRTTLIAGFPSETPEEFTELCEMVKELKFERLGCFAYSPEEGTPASRMPDQLDEREKQHRAEIVMTEQYAVAMEVGERQIGKRMRVLVEGYDAELNQYYGRSAMDAPDIDTKVYFKGSKFTKAGSFVTVKIKKLREYDLLGIQVAE
ncbi:MAG: 30S ribosomal protein S12 methylthiotransferase RimO [Oscillospiraceae bacterium]|nr:30S ribosomal protein S12 methylthiotransferase RimO [Oscillospiraceae bacterium]